MNTYVIGKEKASIHDVWEVAHHNKLVAISRKTKEKIQKGRTVIEDIIKNGEPIYGVNTGFGDFQNRSINTDEIKILQTNLIRSHAVGVGPLFSRSEVRAAMFCRLLSNAQGYSGIRLEVLEKIVELLNKNIIPAVPSQGSVGASGDLAPLSHCILVLMGEGKIMGKNGCLYNTSDTFQRHNIKPIVLEAKEGLALNNGTAFMAGVAALSLMRSKNLIQTADIAAAMSIEALEGFTAAFDDRAQQVRGHLGQKITAKHILSLLHGSTFADINLKRHGKDELKRVQDAYSLRCIPQVHGAVKDAYLFCKQTIETEINSVNDNPLIFTDEPRVISSGNFHGAPIGYVMDFLGIVLSDLGNISERRTFRLITGSTSTGLPGCLIENGGLNSGFMITQYTAANLCGTNQVLAHPASVGTIPTSGNQEDHVSFGSIAANKSRDIIDNLQNILAIELLCAYQGIRHRKKIILKHFPAFNPKLGKGTKIMLKALEKNAGLHYFPKDENFGIYINAVSEFIESAKHIKILKSENIIA